MDGNMIIKEDLPYQHWEKSHAKTTFGMEGKKKREM